MQVPGCKACSVIGFDMVARDVVLQVRARFDERGFVGLVEPRVLRGLETALTLESAHVSFMRSDDVRREGALDARCPDGERSSPRCLRLIEREPGR